MGRPADWWVLDLDGDPTPGDPFRVRELARKFSELSSDAFDAAAEVRRLAGEGGVTGWVGEAGTVFTGAIGELPGQLDKLETSYGMVGRALTTYAGELESAQSQADGALVRGRAARERLEAAQGQVAAAQADVTSARTALDTATGLTPLTTVSASWSAAPPALPPDPAVVTAATTTHTAAVDRLAEVNGQVTDAQDDLDAEHRLAVAARGLREQAAATCKGEIDRASDAGIHNRSFWDKAGDFLSDAWDIAVNIAKVVVVVAGIAALIVGGPLAWIALAAAVVVLADTLMKYANGEADMWDVGLALVDCIPGAKGVTTVARLGKGFRAVGAGLRGGAGGVAALSRTAFTAGASRLGSLATSLRGGLGSLRNVVTNPRGLAVPPWARRTCGDPVDVVSGEMVLGQFDVDLPGLLPLTLERTHVSSYRSGHLFGPSWASTLDLRLEVDAEGVCFAGGDGTVLVYPTPPEDGTATLPAEGRRWPLSVDADGTYRVVDRQAGRTWCFGAPDRTPEAVAAGFVAVLRLAAVVDRNGHRMDVDYDYGVDDYDYDYNGDGVGVGDSGAGHSGAGSVPRVVGVRHSGGYRVAVDTSAAGRVTGLKLLTDGGGGDAVELVGFGYDADGRLAEVVNSSGASLRFGYDAEGRLTAWTDRNGRWYQYVYDEAGRCVRTIGTGGFLSGTFDYRPDARTTVATDSLGHPTTFVANELGQVVRETDPLGHVTVSEWGRYDWLMSRTDPLGRTTRFRYDEVGNLVEVSGADGAVARAEYDERSRPTVVVEPDGARWERVFDERGNLVSVTDPAGATTEYAYDPSSDRPGHVAAVTDVLGNRTEVETNLAGLPVRVVSPAGATTRLDYGPDGRVTRTVDPVGGVSEYRWTVEGKLTSRTGPDGAAERWTYDGEGNLVEHVDPAGLTTRFDYTHFDLPAARIEADGSRLAFGYDTELRPTSVTNPQGLVWNYVYDPAGRLVAETDFDGRLQRYDYDPAGQLVARTNGAGQTVTFVRDHRGETVEEHTENGVVRFARDRAGRVTYAANTDVECGFVRDPLGRVLAETVGGHRTTSTYDALGRRVRRVTPSGLTSVWEWDADGMPLALRVAGRTVEFGHDAAGRETERRLDSGLAFSHGWDAAHRLISQAVTAPGLAASGAAAGPGRRLLQQRAYSYSPDGYLAAVTDLHQGSRQYTLDEARRVTAVAGPDWHESYAYDQAGNLADAAWPARADQDNAFATDVQGDRAYAGTRLRRAGKIRYEYDGQGRVVLRQQKRLSGPPRTWRYTWDAADRLVGVVTPDGGRWRYVYDPFGRRVAKQRVDFDGTVLDQTYYCWDGVHLAEQHHDKGADSGDDRVLAWEREPGTHRPLAQLERTRPAANEDDRDPGRDQVWYDNRFYAIVTDLVGAPTELLDPDGDVVWQHRATLWGVPASDVRGNSVDCPLRFPGQYHDPEAGLDYNYHRYYDPTTARYLSADPLGLAPAPNPVTYVHNPLIWTDPLGLAPCRLGQLKMDLGRAGMSVRDYDIVHVPEIIVDDVTTIFGRSRFLGDGTPLLGPRGRPLIEITDAGLSSRDTAVRTLFHEIYHQRSARAFGTPGYEHQAEEYGERMLVEFLRRTG